MAISNRKLAYYKDGIKYIALYDNVNDVQGNGFRIQADEKTLFAKIGDIAHNQASNIKINKDGVKCLLYKAITVLNFNNINIRYKNGSASASGASATLVGKYDSTSGKYTDAEFQWDVTIPPSAKNVVVKFDWETQNKPVVDLNWFNHTLKLDQNSTVAAGHFEFNIPAGGIWDNRCTTGSYDAGIFNKYLYIRNFTIEFEEN